MSLNKKSKQKIIIGLVIIVVGLFAIAFFSGDTIRNIPVIGGPIVDLVEGFKSPDTSDAKTNKSSSVQTTASINIMSEFYSYEEGTPGYNKAKAVENAVNNLCSEMVSDGKTVGSYSSSALNAYSSSTELKRAVKDLVEFKDGSVNDRAVESYLSKYFKKAADTANTSIKKAKDAKVAADNKAKTDREAAAKAEAKSSAISAGFNQAEFNKVYNQLKQWDKLINKLQIELDNGKTKEELKKSDLYDQYKYLRNVWSSNGYEAMYRNIEKLSLTGTYETKQLEMANWYSNQDIVLVNAGFKN